MVKARAQERIGGGERAGLARRQEGAQRLAVSVELLLAKQCPLEAGVVKARTLEIGAAQVRAFEVRAAEIGAAQIREGQRRSGEVGAREIGLLWSGNFLRVWRQVLRFTA